MKSILVDVQHATKESEEAGGGGGGGGLHKHKEDVNYLELRLGVISSSDHDCTSTDHVVGTSSASASASASASRELLLAGRSTGPKLTFLSSTNLNHGSFHSSTTTTTTTPAAAAGTKRTWVMPETDTAAACCGGFVHPWSLAARQQKAAFEQAHHMSDPSSSTAPRFAAPPTPPAAVGWPPVRAFRRNIVGSQTLTKPEMNGEKEAKKSKVTREEDTMVVPESRPTLFVKVNMEGFVVGRKINLKAYHSYDSLSRALQKMFNFLSANYCNNSTEEEQEDNPGITDYILLYEDHEGDRMLVGDVPWDMFITTVKRLHIAHNPKARKSEKKKERDGDTNEQ